MQDSSNQKDKTKYLRFKSLTDTKYLGKSIVRQGTYKLWQTSASLSSSGTKCHRGLKKIHCKVSWKSLRVYHPQQVLSKTFYVLIPGFWHLSRIHVSQIRNSYFSTSATISDSKSFWTSCLLLNLLPASTSFTQTASMNLHPELYSKHSHQVATHPISLKKFRANKSHLQQQVSYKPLHSSCRVPSSPLNNFISD